MSRLNRVCLSECWRTVGPALATLCLVAPPLKAEEGISNAPVAVEWCRQWSMESRVAQSQLILVARVSNISAVSVVHGAKVDTTLREYRFQPVAVLKGVFTRDELAMTDTDLGLPAPDPNASAPFEIGEHILLLLTRTQGNFGCVGLPQGWNNPRQLIPRLAGDDDPIVSMTRTLVQVSQTPSRAQRVQLTIEKLDDEDGPAVVPLLMSLSARGYWVQTTAAANRLAELTTVESPAVRAAAARAISQVLYDGAPVDDATRDILVGALRKLLESRNVDTRIRVAALTGLGRLGEYGRRTDWVGRELLRHLQGARTRAERFAAAAALGELAAPETLEVLLDELRTLPLDEQPELADQFVDAVVKVGGDRVAPLILQRLQEKLNAGHPAHREIRHLGELQHAAAMPTLLQAARDAAHYDESQLAEAFGILRDERAVPVLADWLASTNSNIRSAALVGLMKIDSKDAVAAVRLRLKSEPDLRLKLRMAAALGRHGIPDGYPIALEHLADPGMTLFAARALADIQDERTSAELWKILDTSHDAQWSGAALHGLAALRDPKVGKRLTEILADQRSPLLASAITAAQELGDPRLISAIAPHLLSRNYNIAQSSITAVRQLAIAEGKKMPAADAIKLAGTSLLDVLKHPDIHMKLRISALDALQSLGDTRLSEALRQLADRSQLENTELLRKIGRVLATS